MNIIDRLDLIINECLLVEGDLDFHMDKYLQSRKAEVKNKGIKKTNARKASDMHSDKVGELRNNMTPNDTKERMKRNIEKDKQELIAMKQKGQSKRTADLKHSIDRNSSKMNEGDFDFHHKMFMKSTDVYNDLLSKKKKESMDKDVHAKKIKSIENGSVKHFNKAASLQMGPSKEVIVPNGQKKRKGS